MQPLSRLNLQVNCVKDLRGTLDVLDVLTNCCSGAQMAGTCTERNEHDARRRPSSGRDVLSRLHSETLVVCWSLHRYDDFFRLTEHACLQPLPLSFIT